MLETTIADMTYGDDTRASKLLVKKHVEEFVKWLKAEGQAEARAGDPSSFDKYLAEREAEIDDEEAEQIVAECEDQLASMEAMEAIAAMAGVKFTMF